MCMSVVWCECVCVACVRCMRACACVCVLAWVCACVRAFVLCFCVLCCVCACVHSARRAERRHSFSASPTPPLTELTSSHRLPCSLPLSGLLALSVRGHERTGIVRCHHRGTTAEVYAVQVLSERTNKVYLHRTPWAWTRGNEGAAAIFQHDTSTCTELFCGPLTCRRPLSKRLSIAARLSVRLYGRYSREEGI
jgi:hypothetical protein